MSQATNDYSPPYNRFMPSSEEEFICNAVPGLIKGLRATDALQRHEETLPEHERAEIILLYIQRCACENSTESSRRITGEINALAFKLRDLPVNVLQDKEYMRWSLQVFAFAIRACCFIESALGTPKSTSYIVQCMLKPLDANYCTN